MYVWIRVHALNLWHIETGKVDGCGWLVLQPITSRMEIITIKVVCVRIVLKILFYQLPIMSEQVRLSCGDNSTQA